MIVETDTDGTDGRFTLLGAFGPTVETLNIPNNADLSLTKTVDDPSPNVGENVVYTLTITNNGTAGATNVAVTDVVPAGMSFVTSSASQGTYDNNTSIWSVGDLPVGAIETLDITAAILTPGAQAEYGRNHGVGSAGPGFDARQWGRDGGRHGQRIGHADADRPVADKDRGRHDAESKPERGLHDHGQQWRS